MLLADDTPSGFIAFAARQLGSEVENRTLLHLFVGQGRSPKRDLGILAPGAGFSLGNARYPLAFPGHQLAVSLC